MSYIIVEIYKEININNKSFKFHLPRDNSC